MGHGHEFQVTYTISVVLPHPVLWPQTGLKSSLVFFFFFRFILVFSLYPGM